MKVIRNIVCIACLLHIPAHAEIYKWRDAKGVMNYSDVPPPAGKQSTQEIKASKVSNEYPLTRSDAYKESASPAQIEKETAAGKGQQKKPLSDEAEAVARAAETRMKAQNCAAARTNYRNYAVGGRMQNVNEFGEREYLSDEQIRENLARAQFEIDENCPVE
ncbi:MAG: DUF4124 domain-containing protein [Methylophilus sp.]|uniref:DUF4124 domain-containing protein n=1 Tax=Methylophilus sp. TaxID=29541 RepID=UPI003FA09490